METSPNITIGIMSSDKVEFNLSGKYTISEIETPLYGSFKAEIKNNAIHLSSSLIEFEFQNEVILLPCSITSDYFELKEVTIGIDFHWEQKEDQKFQGALKLKIANNKIQVINIIPIENYLVSVISSEMSANSSLNLLKAHAIISRSWLMAQMERQNQTNGKKNKSHHKKIHTDEEYIHWYDREDHKEFIVCADDHCQRYQGITRSHNPNVIKAIQETMGQVLVHNNSICDARYSKSCGGASESFKNCWEPVDVPYLSTIFDKDNAYAISTDLTIEQNAVDWINSNPEAFCNTTDEKILSQVLNEYDVTTRDSFRWTVNYTQKELAELIREKSGIDFGQIIDLIPLERGTSARLIKLKIIGSKKTMIIGKELEIRKWLSKSHLYSSAILVEKENIVNGIPEKFVIKGAGWGHGVGLCQIGAAVMGEKGYSYEEILYHYYKNVSLEKQY